MSDVMSIEGTARAISSEPDAIAEAPFHIPATGIATRARCTLKYGDTFVVVDSHGDIGTSAGGPDGLFHKDTRFLSHLKLSLNGCAPLLLGFSLRDDNTMLASDLTNPDIHAGGQITVQQHTLHVVRSAFLWRNLAYQRLTIRNHGDRPVAFRLAINFDSDFADLFEVRGVQRRRRGVAVTGVTGLAEAVLSYQGLDGKRRRTTLSFDPQPSELSARTACYRLNLAPGGGASVFMTIGCNQPDDEPPVSFQHGLR